MSQPARSQLPAFFTLLGSALVIAMLVGHGWLKLGVFGEGGVGPMGIEVCTAQGACRSLWWGSVPLSGAVPTLAILTLVTGVCAFGFAVSCGVFGIVGRVHDIPHRMARVLLVGAIASAVTWLVVLGTNKQLAQLTSFDIASIDYAGVLCVIALGMSLVGVHRLAKHARAQVSSDRARALPAPWPQAETIAAPPGWAPPAIDVQPSARLDRRA